MTVESADLNDVFLALTGQPAKAPTSDELAELLDSVFLDSVPIARRLRELLQERGWRGLTKLERIPAR